MRNLLWIGLVAASVIPTIADARGGGSHSSGGGSHYVSPHVTKNGTYVQGHYQTNPNGSKADNWSTQGNVNPYTGKEGTADPSGGSQGSSYSLTPATPRAEPAPSQFLYEPAKPIASRAPKSISQVRAAESSRRAERSTAMRSAFQKMHPCPSTGRTSGACPGYVVDHIKPLCANGMDLPSNMQWQSKSQAASKDGAERKECARR